MANEIVYEWKLTGIVKSTPSTLPVSDVVVAVRWVVTGTDEDGNSAVFNGSTPFELSTVDPDNFTPYNELTEEQVLGWVENYVKVVNPYWDHVQQQIDKKIEESKQSIQDVSADDLPWSPTSGSNSAPAPEPILNEETETEVSGSEE